MTVRIFVQLSEKMADAFLAAHADGRKGWHSIPSLPLAEADRRIARAIEEQREVAP